MFPSIHLCWYHVGTTQPPHVASHQHIYQSPFSICQSLNALQSLLLTSLASNSKLLNSLIVTSRPLSSTTYSDTMPQSTRFRCSSWESPPGWRERSGAQTLRKVSTLRSPSRSFKTQVWFVCVRRQEERDNWCRHTERPSIRWVWEWVVQ